jgi:hypothetical protein
MKLNKTLLSLAVSMALTATGVNASQNNNTASPTGTSPIQHVLLISVDGLHQNDLNWFVKNNPNSTLAGLVNNGVSYSSAQTPFPSDSFPGMVAQTTGGNPKSTGVYYDDEYSRSLLPKGTTADACQNWTSVTGAEVFYAEVIEPNSPITVLFDAGQGIPNLYPVPDFTPGDLLNVPTNILKLAGSPDDLRNIEIDPTLLPVDPVTCNPVYPYQYLRVNTIFEVAKAHGLHTAWVDKHPAYEIMNGPSGYGIDDMFSPEINSVINLTDPNAPDWTKSNIDTQKYDTFHVLAVVNEINGNDHSGKNSPGTPAIFGLNFQAVSTAQKLNTSATPQSSNAGQLGGYNTDGTPGPVLVSALNFVDASLKQMQDAINANLNTQGSTAIIVSAKHGQSPVQRSDLTLINDGTMTAAANAAWATAYPKATQPLIAHPMDDDGVLWWLNDRSPLATNFAKNFLLNYTGTGVGSDALGNKTSKTFTSAGLNPSQIYVGAAAAKYIGVSDSDDRYPDVIGIAQTGSVYAGGKLSKIAEHGGGNINDRHVPIVVSAPGVVKTGKTYIGPVETTQIAPTILSLLGISPKELQAVQIEGTQVLPNLK